MEALLSADFWTRFVDVHWKRRPAVFKGLLGEPVASPAEIFGPLVSACQRLREGEALPLKFYIEDRQVATDIHRHLPRREDESLDGYLRRLDKTIGSSSFILHLTDFQQLDETLLARMRALLSGLVKRVGVPASSAELEVFLGRYQRTPGGIHKESCANLHFIIKGSKKMLVWPPEAANDREFSVNRQGEEQYLDADTSGKQLPEGIVLEGQPGDVFYWPSGFWHVGESPETSLSLNLALYMKGRPADMVADLARDLVEKRLGELSRAESYPFPAAEAQATAAALPPLLSRAKSIFQDISRTSALEESVMAAWLSRLTSFGFNKLPPRRPSRPLADDERISVDPLCPVAWTGQDAGQLIYAASGYCSITEARQDVARLLERLNSGAVLTVGGLIRECADGNGAKVGTAANGRVEALRAILSELYSMRGIDIID